jgi:hypothetical protein
MGAVARGQWPSPRFPSPLIEPDVPVSGIRLVWGFSCQGGPAARPSLSFFAFLALSFVRPRRRLSSAPSASAGAAHAAGHPTGDQPSIAVLPFVNLSGNADQQHFGDAVANDIITALTRFRWFFVVARQSSFAFRDSATDVQEIASQLVRYGVDDTLSRDHSYGPSQRSTSAASKAAVLATYDSGY